MRRVIAPVLLAAVVGAALAGCNDDGSDAGSTTTTSRAAASTTTRPPLEAMELTSPAFADGELIPVEHTCSGAGTAPELRWSEPPPGTQQVALVVFDPDARGGDGFVHYVGWGIDAGARSLDADGYAQATLGANGTGAQGWLPSCPPPGEEPHRYEFTLYALDGDPGVAPGTDRTAFQSAIADQILGQATLTGRFGR